MNLYSRKRWWYGWITNQKKKYWGALDVKVPFFEIKFYGAKKMFAMSMLMSRCPCWCRDFGMAENKLHVYFLHKQPIRNSVLGTFSTHKINKLLELQKHVPFVNKRLFLLLFWEYSNFICNCWHFVTKLIYI